MKSRHLSEEDYHFLYNLATLAVTLMSEHGVTDPLSYKNPAGRLQRINIDSHYPR